MDELHRRWLRLLLINERGAELCPPDLRIRTEVFKKARRRLRESGAGDHRGRQLIAQTYNSAYSASDLMAT